MLAQYGSENSMIQRKVYEWVERLKAGRTSATDQAWHINIVHISPHQMGECLHQGGQTDYVVRCCCTFGYQLWITCHNSWWLGGTVKFAQDGYPNSLLICTSNTTWRLRPNSRNVRKKIQEFWSRFRCFGGETWVHHCDPESKRQSMQWKYSSFPVKKKFKWMKLAEWYKKCIDLQGDYVEKWCVMFICSQLPVLKGKLPTFWFTLVYSKQIHTRWNRVKCYN